MKFINYKDTIWQHYLTYIKKTRTSLKEKTSIKVLLFTVSKKHNLKMKLIFIIIHLTASSLKKNSLKKQKEK